MNNVSKLKKSDNKVPETHKTVSLIAALFFFVFIIIADLLLIFNHDKTFSETENRTMQQAPRLTFNALTSGKFMNQFEDFIADQFFLRDNWIGTKLKMDKLSGRRESNNVILGRKGYLLEDAVTPNEEFIGKSVAGLSRFADDSSASNIVMTIVPNAVYVLDDFVPSGAPVRNQADDIDNISSQLADNINFVNVNDILRAHADEYIYYKSDHHWTSLGAKYAFEALAPALGLDAQAAEYDVYTVATDFSGTMASASGSFNTTDKIDIYVASGIADYYVEYAGDAVKYPSIYKGDALEQKNKYEVFLGGNFPRINITTLNKTGRNLMLIKDSYANSIVQFLLPYYDQIVILDPRYYSDDLYSEVRSKNITDVLILYNENTFALDNSLAGVLDPVE